MYEQKTKEKRRKKKKKKEEEDAFWLEKFKKRIDGVISSKGQYRWYSSSTIDEFGLWFLGSCHKKGSFGEKFWEGNNMIAFSAMGRLQIRCKWWRLNSAMLWIVAVLVQWISEGSAVLSRWQPNMRSQPHMAAPSLSGKSLICCLAQEVWHNCTHMICAGVAVFKCKQVL